MERTDRDNIAISMTIRTLHPGGRLERTLIHPITEEDTAGYHSLGTASGAELGMVQLMARKHCPGFAERVTAYRVVAPLEGVEIPVGPGQRVTTIKFFEGGAV